MADAYVRGDGRMDCKTCMKMRSRAARKGDPHYIPPEVRHKKIWVQADDDVVVAMARETAESLLPVLDLIAHGPDTESGRAAKWLLRALQVDMAVEGHEIRQAEAS